MKIYDVFAEEFITEEQISPYAPPERYILIEEEPKIENNSKYNFDIENSIDTNNLLL